MFAAPAGWLSTFCAAVSSSTGVKYFINTFCCNWKHSLLKQLLKALQKPLGSRFHTPATALSPFLIAVHFLLREQHLLHCSPPGRLPFNWKRQPDLEGVFKGAITSSPLHNLEKYTENGYLKRNIFLYSWVSFHFAPTTFYTNFRVIILLNYNYLGFVWMSPI